MSEQTTPVKRYNLVLPEPLFNEVQRIADERQTTVVDIIRRFIKLGLLAAQLENSPESALLIREGNKEKQIILV